MMIWKSAFDQRASLRYVPVAVWTHACVCHPSPLLHLAYILQHQRSRICYHINVNIGTKTIGWSQHGTAVLKQDTTLYDVRGDLTFFGEHKIVHKRIGCDTAERAKKKYWSEGLSRMMRLSKYSPYKNRASSHCVFSLYIPPGIRTHQTKMSVLPIETRLVRLGIFPFCIVRLAARREIPHRRKKKLCAVGHAVDYVRHMHFSVQNRRSQNILIKTTIDHLWTLIISPCQCALTYFTSETNYISK